MADMRPKIKIFITVYLMIYIYNCWENSQYSYHQKCHPRSDENQNKSTYLLFASKQLLKCGSGEQTVHNKQVGRPFLKFRTL